MSKTPPPGDATGSGAGGGTPTAPKMAIVVKRFETSSITKLNGNNFLVWKMRLVSLFTSHKSLNIVNGTTGRPGTAGDAQNEWDQASSEALTALLMCMEDSQVEQVSGCKTAQEIWAKLHAMYESTSGENVQMLWMKFYSIVVEVSPVQAMCQIQNIAAQLRSLKAVCDDDQIVARVISSMLDERFRNFREAWRSMDKKLQKPEQLLSRLKIWELEEAANSGTSYEEDTSGKSFKFGGQKKKMTKEEMKVMKKKSKCFNCGYKGHWASECPYDSDSDGKSDNSGKVYKQFAVIPGMRTVSDDARDAHQHSGHSLTKQRCYEALFSQCREHEKDEAEQPEILEFVENRKKEAENCSFAEKCNDSGVEMDSDQPKQKEVSSQSSQLYREYRARGAGIHALARKIGKIIKAVCFLAILIIVVLASTGKFKILSIKNAEKSASDGCPVSKAFNTQEICQNPDYICNVWSLSGVDECMDEMCRRYFDGNGRIFHEKWNTNNVCTAANTTEEKMQRYALKHHLSKHDVIKPKRMRSLSNAIVFRCGAGITDEKDYASKWERGTLNSSSSNA